MRDESNERIWDDSGVHVHLYPVSRICQGKLRPRLSAPTFKTVRQNVSGPRPELPAPTPTRPGGRQA